MPTVQDFYSGIRWLAAENVSGADIPAFAVLRVSAEAPTGEYQVTQPNADGQDGCLLNNQSIIPGPNSDGVTGKGLATSETPWFALYEPADGAPVTGETWGPGAGSWKLRKGKGGFLIYGGADGTKVEVLRSGGTGGGPTIDVVTNVCSAIGPDNAPAVIAGGVFAKPVQAAVPGAGPGGWTPSVPAAAVIKGQAFSW